MTKFALDCLNPFPNSGLASVNLLPSADKTNYYGPIFTAIQT
jgi:hypothetical protein